MVSLRKRALRDTEPEAEPEADMPEPPKQNHPPSLLHRIRNTWQFANIFQWIYLFGKVVKIDDNFDIDDLEAEFMKPHSTVLADIGLALLKFVSSHRGLTSELFDEYTRRQYVAKAPDRNPFGTDETPAKFDDFDAFTKIKILHQLTQWVMLHPERIREKMDEQKPSDQTEWRIEPAGWDSDDRTYYILDDNRMYRMTEASQAPSAWKPKKNTKKAKAAARAAKRRRVSRSTAQDGEDVDDDSDADQPAEPEDDGLGGAKWECVASNLVEVQDFLSTIRKTRDENEKVLRSTIENHLLPIFEKQEESRKRKALQREKELLNLEKMAHAKRSSRLANKAEQQRLEQQAKEEEQKRRADEVAARKQEQKRLKMEKERDRRMVSRAQRLREREVRRLQHEEELAQLSEDSKNLSSANGRLSERRLQAEIEKNRQALQELEDEEDDWIFDCICGVYGQIDDGTHSVSCEKCNVWQHSKCVGISEEEADRDDFHFICKSCRQKSSGPGTPKSTTIKLKVNQPDGSSLLPSTKSDNSSALEQPRQPQHSSIMVEMPTKSSYNTQLPHPANRSESLQQPSSKAVLQIQPTAQPVIPIKQAGQPSMPQPSSPFAISDGANPFSSPHPNLSPPEQSPNKARAYSTLFNPSSPVSGNQPGEHKAPRKGMFHISPKANGAAAPPSSSLPPHAEAYVPPVAARSDSPLKQPLDAASNSLPVLSPPAVSLSTLTRPQSSDVNVQHALLATPQLNRFNQAGARLDTTPSLPPTQNGISPLKRSPPPNQHPGSAITSTPTPAILPPVRALSPSPSQQILTPPVKSFDNTRPASPHSGSVAGDG